MSVTPSLDHIDVAPSTTGGDTSATVEQVGGRERLLNIGAAAAKTGVTERALRYYQELGLICPAALSKGGMRRYSEADLERVARIRELQTVLGLNLDEIARVLRNEDRTSEIRASYHHGKLPADERRKLVEESLELVSELRLLVEAKRCALEAFVTDLDNRISRIQAAIENEAK